LAGFIGVGLARVSGGSPDLDQHDPGCLNEESAKIAIAAL
jgi:hypothetical protein